MEEKLLRLTEKEITDIYHGLVFAMKGLEQYEKGTERLLADRLERIVEKIESQTR
ncbi:hypothetical protein GCM10023210_14210 [Chryseobacterium ginsengisoli]|uniref:Uncharacterized protein n=1 Tax=Chryseobacterium ginsengisoli TaxID=363853 RepID=A0ABP9M5V7_9FLAO